MIKNLSIFTLLGLILLLNGCKSEDIAPKFPNNSSVIIDKANSIDFVQRNSNNEGSITIVGKSDKNFQSAKIKFNSSLGGVSTDWLTLNIDPATNEFKGKFTLKAGGYYPQIQLFKDNKVYTDTLLTWNVKVGEVFAVIGHSLAEGQRPYTIENYDPTWCDIIIWQYDGAINNYWGRLAEKLKVKLNVPVRIYNTGIGGSSSEQWGKSAYGLSFQSDIFDWKKRYPYWFFEQRCLNDFSKTGLRAIFVEHGENDHGTEENLIIKYTQDYIQKSRDLLSSPQLAFIISKSNFGGTEANISKIRSAQKRMLTEIKNTMEGPDLESVNGTKYRWDGIHFNSAGLEEAAIRWDNSLPISYFSTTSQFSPK
jgi:hypothetical protein